MGYFIDYVTIHTDDYMLGLIAKTLIACAWVYAMGWYHAYLNGGKKRGQDTNHHHNPRYSDSLNKTRDPTGHSRWNVDSGSRSGDGDKGKISHRREKHFNTRKKSRQSKSPRRENVTQTNSYSKPTSKKIRTRHLPDLYAKRQRCFHFNKCAPLRIYEYVSGRPLGVVVWDGAIVLAAYLSSTLPSSLPPSSSLSSLSLSSMFAQWRGKTVVELGSGTGIVGLLLAQLGARVVLTDTSYLLSLMEDNIALLRSDTQRTHSTEGVAGGNGEDNDSEDNRESESSICVTAQELDWSKPEHVASLYETLSLSSSSSVSLRTPPSSSSSSSSSSSPSSSDTIVDVVIGADVLYVDEHIFMHLLDTLLSITTRGSSPSNSSPSTTASTLASAVATGRGMGSVVYLSGAKRHQFENRYLAELRKHFDIVDLTHKVRELLFPASSTRNTAAVAAGAPIDSKNSEKCSGSSSSSFSLSSRIVGELNAEAGTVEKMRLRNPKHFYLFQLTRKSICPSTTRV